METWEQILTGICIVILCASFFFIGYDSGEQDVKTEMSINTTTITRYDTIEINSYGGVTNRSTIVNTTKGGWFEFKGYTKARKFIDNISGVKPSEYEFIYRMMQDNL